MRQPLAQDQNCEQMKRSEVQDHIACNSKDGRESDDEVGFHGNLVYFTGTEL